ncbi:polysaccharide deacetylase family protein [Kitasatospora sp. NPDC048365]|uniref:polysaccharide deacetylase family protein n=1 Tax=Kitasatospora sp. NPDC048365 TaxID=3364050 RepID=UPI003722BF90
MVSDHRIIGRRLLLNVAGVTLLSAATACGSSPSERGPSAGDGPAAKAVNVPSPALAPLPSTAPPSAAPSSGAPQPAVPPVGTAPPAAAARRNAAAPLFSLASDDKLVALTIDDGPDPVYTPAVLSILQRYGVRATFFLVGENAVNRSALVREIARQGHHLANHTWSHPDLRGLSEAKVRDELERTSDLLHAATGKPATWFRAPGGDWSDVALRVSNELGMRPMGWSVDPVDWARPGTSRITTRVLDAIRPGSIVLNHDGGGDRSQTIAALKTYLPVLIDEGYRFTAPA